MEIQLARNISWPIFAHMRFVQALYISAAVLMSAIVIGVSCSQSLSYQVSMETPFEEPLDEDPARDFVDDKEYLTHNYLIEVYESESKQLSGYLVSHINQVKEISTPPPKI